MHYNFDKKINRIGTNSMKWDVNEGELAMSIADMDFETAPCIIESIQTKAKFGIFGYHDVPRAYFESFQQWWLRKHSFAMELDWMLFSSGIIPAISSIVRKLTTPGEKVLIQAPVYNVFYNSILNNGREMISSDLRYDNGAYRIDFEDLEQKLKDPQTTLMILCNPHNPIGKIWDRKTLHNIGELCIQHHVLVVSDEIHCDIIEADAHYLPFASVSTNCAQNSISCLSASKAFNLAGLQSACLVIPNPLIRHKVWRAINTDEVAEPNAFACEATIAAFQHGEDWLNQVCHYISLNKKIAKAYIEENIPQLRLQSSNATYLLWIECRESFAFTDKFCTYLQEKKGLYISSGHMFGKNSNDFIRINIACPKDQMMEGLKRLKEGTKEFISEFIDAY